MKKVLAMLLAAVMVLSLAACGGSSDSKDETKKAETKTEETKAEGDTQGNGEASGDTVEIEDAKYVLAGYVPLT